MVAVVCPKCGSRQELGPATVIPPTGLRHACASCGTVVLVRPPKSGGTPTPPARPPAPTPSARPPTPPARPGGPTPPASAGRPAAGAPSGGGLRPLSPLTPTRPGGGPGARPSDLPAPREAVPRPDDLLAPREDVPR